MEDLIDAFKRATKGAISYMDPGEGPRSLSLLLVSVNIF